MKITTKPLRMDGMGRSVSATCAWATDQACAIHPNKRPSVHTLGQCIGGFGAIPCCFCCPNPFKPVDQGEVGLVTKFGRFAIPARHPFATLSMKFID